MRTCSVFTVIVLGAGLCLAEPPRVLDSRLVLEQVAAEPDIVTPTGIAVDARGRIWCLENHTHQTATGYKGPKSDRIRVFEAFDAAGKAKKVWTFAEGFRDCMGLSFGADGSLYLAMRASIVRFTINDDKETERKTIVKLETKGNYPHNGLCGFAWDPNGTMVFGLGENLGESYSVVGADGKALTGGGEGGSVYRCRPDGTEVERIATGFWNPYAQAFDAQGNLFIVDNDPDSRGPCRLLHVVQGGDFGYKFRYGRKGTHPFVCWNGELPGTLPMVAGTSEAPSGVVAGDFTALPEDYRGELLVTSWGDHTIERFKLQPRGASFSATAKAVVRGDENFRPVAFAIAPDGSVVFSDWVDKSYPVHGKGRIWRLRAKDPSAAAAPNRPVPAIHSEEAWLAIVLAGKPGPGLMQAILQLKSPASFAKVIPMLGNADPYVVSAALEMLGRPGNTSLLARAMDDRPSAAVRLGLLLALRKTGDAEARKFVGVFLADSEAAIRRAAIQWVGEEKLKGHSAALNEAALKPPVSRELLDAWVKAGELLSDIKRPANAPENTDFGVGMLWMNDALPPRTRATALRLIPPDHAMIHPASLERFARSEDMDIVRECLITAMLRRDTRAVNALRIPLDIPGSSIEMRNLAVAGLGAFAENEDVQAVLLGQLEVPDHRYEALRSLRGIARQTDAIIKWWDRYRQGLSDPTKVDRDLMDQYYATLRSTKSLAAEKPRTPDEWLALTKNGEGDAKAGERLFYHAKGPGCYQCHRIDSRGGNIGPELTYIGKALSREKLIDSILNPSKEVAPIFSSWRITTRDGKERVAVYMGETHDSFVLLGDSQGKMERLRRTDIEERVPSPKSIMPDDLANRMTKREFLDLLAFLMDRK